MLPLKAREKSFSSVRSFAGASGGSPDNPYRRVNVMVRRGQEEYLYRGIYMSIGYQYNYMDYKVELTWEDNTSQPDYEDIGLYREYSISQQEFSFSGGRLPFTDDGNQVSVPIGDTVS